MELFTIALIVHQQRHYLKRCLEHIFCQDYRAVELIICDDNSCDFEAEKVEEYVNTHKSRQIQSVTVIKQPSYTGQAACCQTALSLSHGTYLMFLTADQELYGYKALSKAAAYFEQTQCSVLTARLQPFFEDGGQAGGICPSDAEMEWLKKAEPDWLFVQFGTHPFEPCVCSAPVCFRKELLERLGFDVSYPSIPFWTLWLKICRADEKTAVLDEVLVHRRIYRVEDDLGYIAFGMKERHMMECIHMLRTVVLPELKRMKTASVMDRVRCRHAAAVLQMAMDERKWYTWKFGKKLLWKLKKVPVLCMHRCYQMRTGNFYIDTNKELRLLFVCCMMYYLDVPLALHSTASRLIWAAGAAAAFAVLSVKTVFRSCAGILKTVLDHGADRRDWKYK